MENIKSLAQNLNKAKIDLETYLVEIPTYSEDETKYLETCYDNLMFFGRLPKGLMCFDKNGFFIDPQKDGDCLGKVDDFVKNLSTNKQYEVDKEIHIEKYLQKITTKDRGKVQFQNTQNVDFYIIIPWAEWFGITKKDARNWLSILENKNLRYKIFLVNSDILEDWKNAQKVVTSIEININK